MTAPPSQARVIMLFIAIGLVAVVVGWLVNRMEIEWLLAVVLGAIAVGLVFYDFRVGVVCLTLLLPWSASPLVPQTHGFNLINLLMVASVTSLVIPRIFRKEPTVPLPGVVFWYYLLPIAIAVLVAWQHLPQGSANFASHAKEGGDLFAPTEFLKSLVIKPMFYVIYAFLAANAARDTKRPEHFFVAFGLSAVVPAIAIIGATLLGGNVMDRDNFLSWGLQPNSYAMLLALAAGPLLFICIGSGPRLARLASGAAFAIVAVALACTASRGGAVAFLVILGALLLRRRKLTDLMVVVAVSVVLVFLMPEQVQERLTLGLGDSGPRSENPNDDVLTKGRLWVWETLAPDIWLSPVWGGGLNSTVWNSAVTSGRIFIGHPHNMFLAILLDLGFLGFAALMYLYYCYARTFRALSREPSLSPILRDYFAGAFASFLGFLAYCVTNGDYMPRTEQTFLWFMLGFAFAYWHLGQRLDGPVRRKPFGVGVKSAPLPPLGPSQRR